MTQKLESFFNKEDVTILITDSGMGGVSIAADIVERIKNSGIFRRARIIFFNSSFDNKSGYNKLKTNEEKVRIFNDALNSMQQNYKPDLIMIGCNTLSVIYAETSFSKQRTTPVIGIVKTGVDLILEKLSSEPQANIVIFATPTTIAKNSHKKMLIEKGVNPEKIVGISCLELADKIEEGYQSKETKTLVSQFVTYATAKLKDVNQPLIVSLNCTHYGYVLDMFKQEFEKQGVYPVAILNPNPCMSNFIFQADKLHRFGETDTAIEIISKVAIFPDVMKSISELVGKISPQTVQALKNYKRDINLF